MTTYHGCVENAVRAAQRGGTHYFDRDTMQWFLSRTYELYEGRGGSFLVMSNRDRGMTFDGQWAAAMDGRRYYYVVEIAPTDDMRADVRTLDDHMPTLDGTTHGYWTLDGARNLARRMARGETLSA